VPNTPIFINIDGNTSTTLNTSNLEDIADKVFYGARQDIDTGSTYIDIIAGGTAINLADDSYSSRPDDYLNWMWSSNTLRFSMSANGHILMEVY
jgi:hypothetical protein